MSRLWKIALAAVVGVLACGEPPLALRWAGGVSVGILVAPGESGVLDAGRIIVRGPSDTTVNVTPGSTVTIGSLSPGTYVVSLEGLTGNQVEMFGQTPSVQVVRSQNTAVTVTLASFRPTLSPLSGVTLGRQFVVSYPSVAGAQSYTVEWDKSASFPNPTKTSVTGTSAQITVADEGLYYIRVRAMDSFESIGRASDSVSTVIGALSSVGVGQIHSCASLTSGAAYCWGYNVEGELGNGVPGSSHTVPVAVQQGALRLQVLSVGDYHTCSVTTASVAYCWGLNSFGRLGDSTTTNRSAPTAVQGGLLFNNVSAGGSHTCGVAGGGTAYCWGWNASGQLGTGDMISRPVPTAVGGGFVFSTVSAGSQHTCGLTTGGAAYCWGRNAEGQLGAPAAQTCALLGASFPCSTTPVLVSGGLTFVTVSAGVTHTCGVTASGAAYCWGENTVGELGDGAPVPSRAQPVAVHGGFTFAWVSAGKQGYTCGVTIAGQALCWGLGGRGELGDSTTITQTAPVAVWGGLTFLTASARGISAGAAATCAVAVTGAGYCWGANPSGELGDGTMNDRWVPTRVSNP